MRSALVALLLAGSACNAFGKDKNSEELAVAAAEILACRARTDDKERLACFDKASERTKTVVGGMILSALQKSDAKFDAASMIRIAAEDLYLRANRFVSKSIELPNMLCYAADDDDFRCVAPGISLAVFSEDVAPAEAKASFEKNCGTLRAAASSACRFTLRLVVESVDNDTVSGAQQRVVVRTSEIQISRPPSEGRRRR
ncbi:MAG TPA: hypothetical protein VIL72_04985 [Beijerinckiaceae bacterium]|jgi:hypothetical protein